jgi:hypothetical protein
MIRFISPLIEFTTGCLKWFEIIVVGDGINVRFQRAEITSRGHARAYNVLLGLRRE